MIAYPEDDDFGHERETGFEVTSDDLPADRERLENERQRRGGGAASKTELDAGPGCDGVDFDLW